MKTVKMTVMTVGVAVALLQPQSVHAAEFDGGNLDEYISLGALDVGDPEVNNGDRSAYSPYPGDLNAAERNYCMRHLPTCRKAKSAADEALSKAQSLYPQETLFQGTGDAFRHCYWSARLTLDVGESAAKEIGDNHESETEDEADKEMDLANNATGRQVGTQVSNYEEAEQSCREKVDNGELVILK